MRGYPPAHERDGGVEPTPGDVPSEDEAYRLYVIEKVREGIRDIAANRTSSTQDVLREIETW